MNFYCLSATFVVLLSAAIFLQAKTASLWKFHRMELIYKKSVLHVTQTLPLKAQVGTKFRYFCKNLKTNTNIGRATSITGLIINFLPHSSPYVIFVTNSLARPGIDSRNLLLLCFLLGTIEKH